MRYVPFALVCAAVLADVSNERSSEMVLVLRYNQNPQTGCVARLGNTKLDWTYAPADIGYTRVTREHIVSLDPDNGALTALDRRTGRRRWTFRRATFYPQLQLQSGRAYVTEEGGNLFAVDIRTGAALANAAGGGEFIASGDRVFAINEDGDTLICYDADLKEQWRARSNDGFYGPEASHERLYVLDDSGLIVCFDAATGARLWSLQNESFTLRASGSLVVGSDGQNVFALDAATGKELWKTDVGGAYEIVEMFKDRVIISSERQEYVCLALDSGKKLWSLESYQVFEETEEISRRYAVLHKSWLFAVTQDRKALHAIDVNTGNIAWKQSFDKPVVGVNVYGNRVYAASSTTLFALEPASGKTVRKFDLGRDLASFDLAPSN